MKLPSEIAGSHILPYLCLLGAPRVMVPRTALFSSSALSYITAPMVFAGFSCSTELIRAAQQIPKDTNSQCRMGNSSLNPKRFVGHAHPGPCG